MTPWLPIMLADRDLETADFVKEDILRLYV